ncbi:MAG: hypothetical protein H0T62_12840 [Parachlamydiaceae bacterium]|nr:hypothetical protein [Parachlamydiaceae bacterium]
MHITIAERFRPFTHLPGTCVLLPLAKLRFQIYPAFIRVCDLSVADPVLIAEISLNLQGPLNEFTVMQDLEKGCLKVWGFSKKGFFRYRIHATTSFPGFTLIKEKVPEETSVSYLPEIYCKEQPYLEMHQPERLSFGVTKVADWELVRRRMTLSEILPFWFRLGQLIPSIDPHDAGTASLLKVLKSDLTEKKLLDLSLHLKDLYCVGFEGLLSCSLVDPYCQGISLPEVPNGSSCSPLLLLTGGAKIIRQMFLYISQESSSALEASFIEILPCLLPELHAGRICGASLSTLGLIDLEWSKKKIRKMIFHSTKNQIIYFQFQAGISSFRLREASSTICITKACGESIVCVENSTYFFDHFQH